MGKNIVKVKLDIIFKKLFEDKKNEDLLTNPRFSYLDFLVFQPLLGGAVRVGREILHILVGPEQAVPRLVETLPDVFRMAH